MRVSRVIGNVILFVVVYLMVDTLLGIALVFIYGEIATPESDLELGILIFQLLVGLVLAIPFYRRARRWLDRTRTVILQEGQHPEATASAGQESSTGVGSDPGEAPAESSVVAIDSAPPPVPRPVRVIPAEQEAQLARDGPLPPDETRS